MNPTEPAPLPMGAILFLLVFLAALGLWLGQHLGLDLLNPVVTAAAAVGTFFGLVMTIAKFFGLKLDDWLRSFMQRYLVPVATSPVLLVFAPAALVLMLAYSSVSVVADEGRPATTVALTPLDRPENRRTDSLSRGDALGRFGLVRTQLFGRLYRVEADGYLPGTVSVHPFIGRRVVLGTDLIPVPTVLFRPFVRGLGALASGGVFTVSRVGDAGLEPLTADSGAPAAFRLGRAQPVTAAMVQYWGLQLDIAAAPPAARARMLLWWNTPRPLATSAVLHPDDSLLAEIRLQDVVVARAGVRLGRDRLMDVALEDLPE